MYSLLLAIIYLAFISLGLPDSLLGSAWPTIYPQLDVPVSYAGIVSMIIAGGTIVSSLMSDKLTRKLSAGLVTAISVMMTAAALFGFSISNSFIALCVWAVPYGLGAGAVDAALNNYVALHYSSRHMSWLHCFWGVGVAVSPYIMSTCLSGGYGWHSGYRTVSIIQMVITAILFSSLSMWKKRANNTENGEETAPAKSIKQILKIAGVKPLLVAFFGYCAVESTAGLWASSYFVMHKGIDSETAAGYASMFYIGITAGRFISGFVADKIGDKNMIRLGLLILTAGVIIIMIPIQSTAIALIGLILTGIGCAPIYPSIIHATPSNFGKENSQAIIGIQMASAYSGSTFIPPLFGSIAGKTGFWVYPFALMIFAIVMIVMTEILNRKISKKV